VVEMRPGLSGMVVEEGAANNKETENMIEARIVKNSLLERLRRICEISRWIDFSLVQVTA